VAFSSSVEESERIYSGTSSVPKISAGSKSRLRKQRGTDHKIAIESKKRIDRKLTLEWCASLMERYPP
jgi:hypothetical protein